jgi:3-hydroxymyristoyl/3-hydroxydecanoyl-(acyl carrier protein) dehydratase
MTARPHIQLLKAAIVAVALLLSARSASADDPPSWQKARAYAEQNQLTTKILTAGPANRQVQRLFVPVTPQSWAAFHQAFNQATGYASLCYTANSRHMAMTLQPGTDCYLWARNYNGTVQGIGDYRNMYMAHQPGGYVLPVCLQGDKLTHLSQWLQARANPTDQLYRGGNCMEWLSNAEVAPGQALFHFLGIKRSKDGGNMKAKMIHAGNSNLDVVGICVSSLADFNTMSNDALLGPPPAGGIPDAAR